MHLSKLSLTMLANSWVYAPGVLTHLYMSITSNGAGIGNADNLKKAGD